MTTEIWKLSASDLCERIRAADLSAREAVGASIERMHAVNPKLNAVVDDLSQTALERARALDEEFVKSGPVGPLHGVPVTIKENIDQTGRATPNGVVAFKNLIAPGNSPVVDNLEKAGAVVIGRTNTPEFSFRATTENDLHGRTFNPWNDWASSGGSSGGASSAVISGMGALAHGNDIGGSLRFLAAATGAATVKPGLGRVPAYNPSQSEERGLIAQLTSVQGLIAREVRDVRLGMKSLIGYDPHDPWQVAVPFDGPMPEGRIRVAFTKNPFEYDLHPSVSTALDGARAALQDAGYDVQEVEPPLIQEAGIEGGRTLFGEVKVLLMSAIREHGSAKINRIFDSYFEVFPPYEGDDLLRAMARRSHYIREWQLFLQEYPLVLTPLLLFPTYEWDRDEAGYEGAREIFGKSVYSLAMNFMGLPAGNVPASFNDGLPVGVQVVGARFREDMILDACEAIEDRVGVMARRLFSRETSRAAAPFRRFAPHRR